MGEVVTGVGEFDADVLEELFGVVGSEVVEFGLGEFFGVPAAAFGFVEVGESFQVNVQSEAVGRLLGAVLLDGAIGLARGEAIEDFVELVFAEVCEG